MRFKKAFPRSCVPPLTLRPFSSFQTDDDDDDNFINDDNDDDSDEDDDLVGDDGDTEDDDEKCWSSFLRGCVP